MKKYYARVKTYTAGKIAFDHDLPYLTEGKWYKAFDRDNGSFCVTDDTGQAIFCLDENCSHLNGGDWEILSEDEIDAMVDELWETVD